MSPTPTTSKTPVVARPAPTLSSSKHSNNNIMKPSSFGHEVVKLEDIGCSSNNDVVVSSSAASTVLVPRQHGTASNEEALMLQNKDSGRERLKRHREEVAGRVLIPDKWGKEELLKDWIDYSSFDKLLAPSGLALARQALMGDGRRNGSQRLRIESMC
ncbi:hypothetical protein CCACVL1_30959 [Corchorus capsularis]|uniref:Uncharacterized protein n=1 Tax=Corchorus capsularis TaxID=210143 RepID=A0A1R3FUH6_COCAP|nr:hypothetical protein CCACVL1_30959 [Corchorus capsularis]